MLTLRLVLTLTVLLAPAVGCSESDAPSVGPDPGTPSTSAIPETSASPETSAYPTTPAPPTSPVGDVEFDFNFGSGAEGWTAGYADLPVGYDQSLFELESAHRSLPQGLEGSAIYIQGHNRSDDLFMFLKRQIDGLEPSATYSVSVSIDLAANVPLGTFGIGGSPGESVFVKAGASSFEPLAEPGSEDHLRMNIDKGNQAGDGSQMRVIGDVANPEVVGDEYRIKNLSSGPDLLNVTADSEGRAWLIVGTDSGFEGLTSLYYDRISFALNHSDPS